MRHVMDYHTVVLPCSVDGQLWIPGIEYVVAFKVDFTATFLPELPFYSGIYFPEGVECARTLNLAGNV